MIRFPYLARRGDAPGYKGVRPNRGKFTAQVHKAGKRYHLGTFSNDHHAAWAVNMALEILYPGLPDRFLNQIFEDAVPTQRDQESIQKEVLIRLGS
jgi:hypothetical protein